MKDETRLKLYDLLILQQEDVRVLQENTERFLRSLNIASIGRVLENKNLQAIFEVLSEQSTYLYAPNALYESTLHSLKSRAYTMKKIIQAEVFPSDSH